MNNSRNAYITGSTQSRNFPTTTSSLQPWPGRSVQTAFVSKLNTAGTALIYSTYLGGNDQDIGRNIAVDATGAAYVVGLANSTDFPTTPTAFQRSAAGSGDVFVTKLDPSGSALLYSTYLGGNGLDQPNGIVVDTAGQ